MGRIKKTFKQIYFCVIKLPLIYIAISIGFIFEYLITFPYIVLCALDRVSQKDIALKKNNLFVPKAIKKKK